MTPTKQEGKHEESVHQIDAGPFRKPAYMLLMTITQTQGDRDNVLKDMR